MIVSLTTERVPYIPEAERLSIDDLGYRDDGITHITGRFGFQDPMDVPALLLLAAKQGIEGDPELDHPSYFVSRISIIATNAPAWRAGARSCSSRSPATPPTPSRSSTCPTSGPS